MPFKIEVTCESDPPHKATITFDETFDRQYLEILADILDGTSRHYIYPPRDLPIEVMALGKCPQCGTWIHAEVVIA